MGGGNCPVDERVLSLVWWTCAEYITQDRYLKPILVGVYRSITMPQPDLTMPVFVLTWFSGLPVGRSEITGAWHITLPGHSPLPAQPFRYPIETADGSFYLFTVFVGTFNQSGTLQIEVQIQDQRFPLAIPVRLTGEGGNPHE
jgi:hypothetical protein